MHTNDWTAECNSRFRWMYTVWGHANRTKRMKVSHFTPMTLRFHRWTKKILRFYFHTVCAHSLFALSRAAATIVTVTKTPFRLFHFPSHIYFPYFFSSFLSLSRASIFLTIRRVKGKNKRFLLENSFFFLNREHTNDSLHTFPSNRW